ncbi:MAG: XRE family transcriptional regulator [Firmicutes bacterium HGW-Firmicutes-16]|nr:MAG: XRE family transcriptional regulator [Firmicutes bacterium HGW-Firmicutes-16]
MVFYDDYVRLCNNVNKAPSAIAEELGLSRASVNGWKHGKIPYDSTLSKIADYFGVSIDYLKGNEQEKTPTLSNKDERDIARDLEAIMADLDKGGALMFDGDPMTDEAKESIKAAMKLGLQAAKQKSKDRFTPNKFRKD